MNCGGHRFCDGAALPDGRADGCHLYCNAAQSTAWRFGVLLPGRPDPADLCPACAARRVGAGLLVEVGAGWARVSVPGRRPGRAAALATWAFLLAALGALLCLAR